MCVYVNIPIHTYIVPYVCIYVSGYYLRVLCLQVVYATRGAVIALLQAQQQVRHRVASFAHISSVNCTNMSAQWQCVTELLRLIPIQTHIRTHTQINDKYMLMPF